MGPKGVKHIADAIAKMPQLSTVKYAAVCRIRA